MMVSETLLLMRKVAEALNNKPQSSLRLPWMGPQPAGGGGFTNIPIGFGSPFTSWSQSSSTSSWSRSAFSGLDPQWRAILKPLFQKSVSGLTQLMPSLLTGSPNMTVLNNYLQAVNPVVERQRINLNTLYNQTIRNRIADLARRGVLDSSVAGRVLGDASSAILGRNADFLAQLYTDAYLRALQYPITVAGVLGGLLSRAIAGGRYARSSGGGSSSSQSQSYSPGLLGALLGL